MLSDREIMKQWLKGNIVIEPFEPTQLGTNSYDCRIGRVYYCQRKMKSAKIDSPSDTDRFWFQDEAPEGGHIIVPKGQTILAHTLEIVGGKNGYVAFMHARSSFARWGLSLCRDAGVGDVGYISRWTMEISNHTRTELLIPVGMRVCQFTFEYVGETLKEYTGKYGQGDWNPADMLPKLHKDQR